MLRSNQARLLAAVLLCAALITAACTSGSKPSQTPAPSGTQEPSMLNWAACVRSNGIPNFPDPNSQGVFVMTPDGKGGRLLNGVAIDMDSPQFQSAQAACQSLLPAGAMGNRDEQAIQAIVKFAACMRENGVPDFPDPTPDGRIRVGMGGVGPDTSSPQFNIAREKCQPLLDGISGGAMQGGIRR